MPINPKTDWEKAFFRALRALRHLYFKHEGRKPLEPERCQGCREIQDFMFKPQFRGDVTDPVGVEVHRPPTESEDLLYCEVCDRDQPVIRDPGPNGDVICSVCKFIFPTDL
jgi:hypothetical protein